MPPRRATAGPDAQALSVGYKMNEKVFFTRASETLPRGNKVVHGQQGEVTGPATGKDRDKRVAVRFPGNNENVNCSLTDVRRLSAASAANRLRPHTRDAAHAPCVPRDSLCRFAPALTACVAARVAQPTARMREGWWPRAWCGV
jgi:hypothetical protein